MSLEVAGLLMQWRAQEMSWMRYAFPALSDPEIEDVYGDVVVELLERHTINPYESALHLRNALRQHLRWASLNLINRRPSNHELPLEEWCEEPVKGDIDHELMDAINGFVDGLPVDERRLLELRMSGQSIKDALGMSYGQMCSLVASLERKRREFVENVTGRGVQPRHRRPHPRRLSDEVRAQVCRAYGEGASQRAVAASLGISHQSVGRILATS